MIKLGVIALGVIALGLFAATAACTEDDWKETLRRGAREMDERNEAFDRRIHDMNMESQGLRDEINQRNSEITQEGILNEMRDNDLHRRYRPY